MPANLKKKNSYHYKTNPNSLTCVINYALIGGQSGMFAPRCEFHAVKLPISENDTWEVSISEVSTVSLHHRTNDQKLLHIIHRNKTFSSPSDPKIRVRIIHKCVLYAEKYGTPGLASVHVNPLKMGILSCTCFENILVYLFKIKSKIWQTNKKAFWARKKYYKGLNHSFRFVGKKFSKSLLDFDHNKMK